MCFGQLWLQCLVYNNKSLYSSVSVFGPAVLIGDTVIMETNIINKKKLGKNPYRKEAD